MNGDHGEPSLSRNRYVVACLTLVVALGLAACTGDSGSTQPTTTVPVTSSPTPSIPVPTAPVQEATPAGAVEFVKYFWVLYNYAYATYDTAPLEAISTTKCSYCASTVADVQKIESAQTRIEGHDVREVDVITPPVKITTGTVAYAIGDQAPGKAVSPSGKAVTLTGAKRVKFTFDLVWNGSQWRTAGVDYDKKSGKPWSG